MNVIETLLQRNEAFASKRFTSGLRMMPSMNTMVIGCVDPRVDPYDILGLEPGEVAVIRNVGGRIFPSTLQTMGMLRMVTKANGGELGLGWNLIVLHHTDCGINCLVHSPELLAKHFGVASTELGPLAITDPRASVAVDVAALKTNPQLPGGVLVTGLVLGRARRHTHFSLRGIVLTNQRTIPSRVKVATRPPIERRSLLAIGKK